MLEADINGSIADAVFVLRLEAKHINLAQIATISDSSKINPDSDASRYA